MKPAQFGHTCETNGLDETRAIKARARDTFCRAKKPPGPNTEIAHRLRNA